MKLPNGFGSVYKLSGKRRNPWAARITTGWITNSDTKKAYPKYKFIGYYSTKKEALEKLTLYRLQNNHTYITFGEIYNRWSKEDFPKLKRYDHYERSFRLASSIHDVPIVDLKLIDYQKIIDESKKNEPELLFFKSMLNKMIFYAIKHELLPREKSDIPKYLDIKKGRPKRNQHKMIDASSLDILWSNLSTDLYPILIMIYTGVRVGELIELKKENIHLEDRYFFIERSKTKSGIRNVPISNKIFYMVEYLMQNDSDYLIDLEKRTYHRFLNKYWKKLKELKLEYIPHDTRHTFISLMTNLSVDGRIIRAIVGHSGSSITENIYTHIKLDTMLKAVDLL